MPDPELLGIISDQSMRDQRAIDRITCRLDPTGEESDWDNDAKQATGPRQSLGKLHLTPDPAD
jgi:hypothetical protein